MKKIMCLFSIFVLVMNFNNCNSKMKTRIISVQKYKSKMKAGWLGQMAGVGWGASTEFKYNGVIIPEKNVPEWTPDMINQQYQDDIYVEMTFLKTLEDYGFNVSIRQAGIDFANSRYMLWHANKFGRDNLRAGIAPPHSGHPRFNSHADDIDYQIEADFSGLIAPGMPKIVIELGDKFGRIMNFGDGLYGGLFVGGMYAEAFFETDINKIIQAGLDCIPAESQYAETVRDVIQWHKENPANWQKTWELINDKYHLNPDYRKFSCSGVDTSFNIDAKINGAYIVMGLLYGNGDMDQTIIVSMRCGMDSDCNPSNAAGILATSLGMEKLPEKYKTVIDEKTKFSFTAYDFPSLIDVCEKLAKKAVVLAGGKIEKNSKGEEKFIIPIKIPLIEENKQCWEADETQGDVHYTAEEMKKIVVKFREAEEFVNVWSVAGPFSKKGVEGLYLFDLTFPPEKGSKHIKWEKMPVGINGYDTKMIDLEKYFRTEHSVAYLQTSIWSNKNQSVLFEIGSDDGIKLWLNKKLVYHNNIMRGHSQGEDITEVTLLKGWNRVLMKVTQGIGGWGASMVITDLEGEPLKGLKYKR